MTASHFRSCVRTLLMVSVVATAITLVAMPMPQTPPAQGSTSQNPPATPPVNGQGAAANPAFTDANKIKDPAAKLAALQKFEKDFPASGAIGQADATILDALVAKTLNP